MKRCTQDDKEQFHMPDLPEKEIRGIVCHRPAVNRCARIYRAQRPATRLVTAHHSTIVNDGYPSTGYTLENRLPLVATMLDGHSVLGMPFNDV